MPVQKLTSDVKHLQRYLNEKGWIANNEKVLGVEVPGAGNMNFTLRIRTDLRSFIIKQSRGYVEKYPQVPAPSDRVLREAEFYAIIGRYEALRARMPALNGVDRDHHVLNLEDLGNGVDFTFLYQKGKVLEEWELSRIMSFAADLHMIVHSDKIQKSIPNREMRKLNHEHIFVYPYLDDNGLDLDDILPGLQTVARPFKEDQHLKAVVGKLGQRYLEDGNTLLHGDYFPGSWLRTEDGLKIIDPEFCFFGEPEFEVGVTLAHLKMAEQPERLIEMALEIYTNKAPLQKDLCFQFMAVEMLRRMLGLAQLPLSLELEKREALLREAKGILV